MEGPGPITGCCSHSVDLLGKFHDDQSFSPPDEALQCHFKTLMKEVGATTMPLHVIYTENSLEGYRKARLPSGHRLEGFACK